MLVLQGGCQDGFAVTYSPRPPGHHNCLDHSSSSGQHPGYPGLVRHEQLPATQQS